jgi:hypothetical protein
MNFSPAIPEGRILDIDDDEVSPAEYFLEVKQLFALRALVCGKYLSKSVRDEYSTKNGWSSAPMQRCT